jgi:MFS family permease
LSRGPIEEHGLIQKDFLVVLVLLVNSLAWYSTIPIMIKNIQSGLIVTDAQNFAIWTAFSLAIIGSSILGSASSNRIDRLDLIYLWIILGVATSSLPALLGSHTVIHVFVISVLLGASFGLGMPSCLAYFADCTLVENRGSTSGIILLITSLSAPLLAKSFEAFNLTVNSIIFAVLRASGLIIFFLRPKNEFAHKTKGNLSFVSILNDRSFVLYFVAWLMFCFIDRFEWPILVNFFDKNAPDFSYFIFMVGPIISSFFALIGGILSDRVGRKRVVLYGFITLGIAYAIIGLAPTETPSISWYSYVVMSSISTGILWVIFFLILWGDFAKSGNGEKYYAIGAVPYFLSDITQIPLIPYVEMIEVVSAFSLASFFLFLAVFPLLYAPETLPERKVELRRLRKYVEGAKKVKEKHEGRSVAD